MRKGLFAAALVLCGVVAAQLLQQSPTPAFGQSTGPVEQPTIMMANAPLPGGGQQVVLVDTQERVLSSYHVDAASGAIALKSVRNFRWDMQMDDFNGGEPKPKEIRALLEQR